MKTLDLNCDMGEGFGAWRMGDDDALLDCVSSANIACGYHAGDPGTMHRTVERALQKGVSVGAHPSLPDLQGFGRRRMNVSATEAYDMVVYQVGALAAFVIACGGKLAHVKPHGALYNDAHHDAARASTIVEALQETGRSIALVCPDASAMATAARACGVTVIREAFADRRYAADGSLVPRSRPGSLLGVDEAADQAALLVSEGVVVSETGTRVPVAFDTICIHADMEHAVERLHAVQQRIRGAT